MVAWRPRHLTVAQFEERRMAAAPLFGTGGFSDAQIARQLGVTRGAVSKWHAAWRHGGTARLAARPKTGRPARLSAAQWQQLAEVIERGARATGFETERWTLRRIAAVIARRFGVHYHAHYLERPLKAHGFSVQRPSTRARERDEYVIARWSTRDWAALKKRRASKASPLSWSMRRGTPSALGRG
jgi:transposase